MNNSPYIENVKDLIVRPGEMRERENTFSVPEHFGEGVAKVPAGTEMKLAMRFESVHEGILASVDVKTRYTAECVRCLTEFDRVFQVDFTELFAYTLTEADEYGVHGDHVNLEPPLRDAVVLALPFGPVCKDDCLGLDPETGELRAAGVPEQEIADLDPRWAALADFQAESNRGEGGDTLPNK